MDKEERQPITVKVMDDEDWFDYCFRRGDPVRHLEKLWREFQAWRKEQGE